MSEPEDGSSARAGTTDEAIYQRALRAELERRLAELAATSDGAFGRMGLADAIVAAVLFLLVPALAVWIFR